MSEHRIRLRGGWECDRVDSPATAPQRLTLPTRWSSEGPRRLRLARQFQRPSVEAGRQVVVRLEQVPGIQSLEINGRPVAAVSPERSEYEIVLDGPAVRYRLVLEVETPAPAPTAGSVPAPDWGVIALVVRGEEPTVCRDGPAGFHSP